MKGKKIMYYWDDDKLRAGRLFGYYSASEIVYPNGPEGVISHRVVGIVEDDETLEHRRVDPELIKGVRYANNDRD